MFLIFIALCEIWWSCIYRNPYYGLHNYFNALLQVCDHLLLGGVVLLHQSRCRILEQQEDLVELATELLLERVEKVRQIEQIRVADLVPALVLLDGLLDCCSSVWLTSRSISFWFASFLCYRIWHSSKSVIERSYRPEIQVQFVQLLHVLAVHSAHFENFNYICY